MTTFSARNKVVAFVAIFGVVLAALLTASSSSAKVRPYFKSRMLQNGIRLNLVERTERPLVEFRILIRAGSRYDPEGKSGLASVTASMLRQGAGSRDALEFQRLIDSIGVRMRIEVTRDLVDISVTVLRKELLSGTHLISDLLMEQQFEAESFERQLQRSVSAVHQSNDADYTALSDFAYQRFFSNDTYGNPPLGSPEQLNSITLADVEQFYERFYAPDRISIIVAGDISAKEYINKIHEALSPYPKNKNREKYSAPEVETYEGDSLEIFLLDTPGAEGARIGFFALCDSASDTQTFGAQLMLAHLLAGFPELSFLGRRLVADVDIVSNLRAQLEFAPGPTLMEIQMDCTGDRVVDAIHETIAALDLLRETRVSKRELEEGKNYYRGYYALGFETAKSVTERFAEILQANIRLKKGHDTLLTELSLLTQSDLRETSEIIFSPARLKIVVRGDAREYAEDLRAYGAVQVISSREARK
jgi:zinc protease